MEWQDLCGKTVEKVRITLKGDEGFKLIFTDGTELEVAFSGDEGDIWINNENVS